MYDKVKLVSLEELQKRNEDLQTKNDAALTLVQRTKGELLNATQELVVADAALAASEARVATLNVRLRSSAERGKTAQGWCAGDFVGSSDGPRPTWKPQN